jgi:hypothetical protein
VPQDAEVTEPLYDPPARRVNSGLIIFVKIVP